VAIKLFLRLSQK